MKITEEKQIDRYRVLVGLNDSVTDLQKVETEKYISAVEYICKNTQTAFSLEQMHGGYLNQNGRYTKENSLAVTFLNITKEQVDALAAEFCALFHQEEVLILHDTVGVYELSAQIEP